MKSGLCSDGLMATPSPPEIDGSAKAAAGSAAAPATTITAARLMRRRRGDTGPFMALDGRSEVPPATPLGATSDGPVLQHPEQGGNGGPRRGFGGPGMTAAPRST